MIIKECKIIKALDFVDKLGAIVKLDDTVYEEYDMVSIEDMIYDVIIDTSRGYKVFNDFNSLITKITIRDLEGEWVSIELDNREYTQIIID